MTRILCDQNVPRQVARLLDGHDVVHASRIGWGELENGALLAEAELAGFAVLVTCDQNLSYQQTIAGRRIGVVVLSTNRWAAIQMSASEIAAAVLAVAPGTVLTVAVPQATTRMPPRLVP